MKKKDYILMYGLKKKGIVALTEEEAKNWLTPREKRLGYHLIEK